MKRVLAAFAAVLSMLVFTTPATASPTGAVELTVVDRATGEPLAAATVWAMGASRFPPAVSTDAQGKARFEDLLPGKWRFVLSRYPDHLSTSVDDVEVKAGETTVVTAPMDRAGVIELTFVDAVTGAPVDGCYVSVEPRHRNAVAPSNYRCGNDGTGKLRVIGQPLITQRVFAFPATSTAHGSQWVGADGGTGDLDQAKWFETVSGQTTSVLVKFDGAGTIRGSVTDDETGAAVSGLCPSVTPSFFRTERGRGVQCTDSGGRYEIGGVGPYAWRVQFPSADGTYAWQWSGDVADRFHATPVQVSAGGTATADARLRKAGQVTGKVLGEQQLVQNAEVMPVNPLTGDYAGLVGRADRQTGEYAVKGLDSQDVRLLYWDDGLQEHPDLVRVEAGRVTSGVDIQLR